MEGGELATIECLPVEILENILLSDVLTYNDIVNFSSTCRRFGDLVNGSSKIWKKKLLLMWPTLEGIFDNQKVFDWQAEFFDRLQIGEFVRKRVSELSAKYIEVEEIPEAEFEDFEQKLRGHWMRYCYVVDELRILFDGDVNCNLTKKYYAVKLMRFLKQAHLKEVWQDFGRLNPEFQLLEIGAVFVAQWCQPLTEVSIPDITTFFDDTAEKVKLLVQSKNSSHPLLSVPPEKLEEWKIRNLSDNYFSSTESKQILTSVFEVIFQHYTFHADSERYQFLETSLLNWAIENRTGTALLISIVIESVARRLGVKCEVVIFPSHLLLRWKASYKPSDKEPDGISISSYIDVFNKGQFLTKRSCPRFSEAGECPMKRKSVAAANATQVMEYLANDILTAVRREGGHSGKSSRVRSALELLVLVNPWRPYNVLRTARFYADYQLNSEFLLDALDKLQNTVDDAERHQLQLFGQALRQLSLNKQSPVKPTPKRNSGKVKYAVGMIMQHRHYRYRCVIFGWDHYCKATPEWIMQMGVGNLEYKTGQPFYNVLVCDGTLRYAAQENLLVHPNPECIEHPLIGRYFDTFCETYYVPNEEKALEYPDDDAVRTRYATGTVHLMET